MLPLIVDWFHKATAHNLGITHLQENLRFHFYHPKLLAEVRKQVSACDLCQRMKRGSRQYGLLASRDARSSPWSKVATDCIGPWNIELRGRRNYDIELSPPSTLRLTYSRSSLLPPKRQLNVHALSKTAGCRVILSPCVLFMIKDQNLWGLHFRICCVVQE